MAKQARAKVSNEPPLSVIVIATFSLVVFFVLVLFNPVANPGGPCYSYPGILCVQRGNTTVAVGPQQELINAQELGFRLNRTHFYASASSQCVKILINGCDNNIPSQFICVNSQYAGLVESKYSTIYSIPVVCPQFFMRADISCGISQSYCAVLNTEPNPIAQANSSS